MMKTTEMLKDEQIASQFEVLLRELLGRVPSLQLVYLKRDARLSAEESYRADLLAQVTAGNRTWFLVVEEKRLGHPRMVRMAVLQLEHYLKQIPGDAPRYGVLLAPFVSEESAKICTEAGIGYADLAGNARVAFDQVFIEMRGADNPFREKREKRSLYAPRAARVLCIMLTPPLRAWRVAELAAVAGVSLGQVSNIRKLLLDREWAVVNSAGLRLSKPKELAQAWQNAYQLRLRSRQTAYTLLHGEALEKAISTTLSEAGKGAHAVLASYSAARWLAPYARQATQFFYADREGAEILKRHLQLQPLSRGENVVVLEPREDDVFSGRIEAAPGIWCSGLVQTWLDLSVAGERGGEAADNLLQTRLLPMWKEASP
jgi:hypothetical protein